MVKGSVLCRHYMDLPLRVLELAQVRRDSKERPFGQRVVGSPFSAKTIFVQGNRSVRKQKRSKPLLDMITAGCGGGGVRSSAPAG